MDMKGMCMLLLCLLLTCTPAGAASEELLTKQSEALGLDPEAVRTEPPPGNTGLVKV